MGIMRVKSGDKKLWQQKSLSRAKPKRAYGENVTRNYITLKESPGRTSFEELEIVLHCKRK